MNILQETLQSIEVGEVQSVHNLTVIALKASVATELSYLLLSEALASGVAELKEVSNAGSVPEIQLINRSDLSILLVDGEELIGCKQNRVVNLTILAPARKTLNIPVICNEQGRWHKTSENFSSSPQMLYAKLRAQKCRDVSASMMADGERRADQGAIWQNIRRKSAKVGSKSRSDAMHGMFEQRRHDILDYVQKFQYTPRQIGALFAINGRFFGFEFFDCEETCQHYLPKIIAGYALDALDDQRDGTIRPTAEMVMDFLQQALYAECTSFPAVGLGQDIRLTGRNISGGGLVVDNSIVHLCVFDTVACSDEEDLVSRGSSHDSIRRRFVPVRRNIIRRSVS